MKIGDRIACPQAGWTGRVTKIILDDDSEVKEASRWKALIIRNDVMPRDGKRWISVPWTDDADFKEEPVN
jgi:hypothetical protein